MSHIILMTPQGLAMDIAYRAQAKRLMLNLSQKSLSERSGVNLSSLKIFEKSGKISFHSLLKVALVLDSLEDFSYLFKDLTMDKPRSLDELLKKNFTRKRGRK